MYVGWHRFDSSSPFHFIYRPCQDSPMVSLCLPIKWHPPLFVTSVGRTSLPSFRSLPLSASLSTCLSRYIHTYEDGRVMMRLARLKTDRLIPFSLFMQVSDGHHQDLGQTVVPVQPPSISSSSSSRHQRPFSMAKKRIQHLRLPMTSGGALKGYLEFDLKVKMMPLRKSGKEEWRWCKYRGMNAKRSTD